VSMFMSRHRLSMRAAHADFLYGADEDEHQHLQDDNVAAIHDFWRQIDGVRRDQQLTDKQVFNFDETAFPLMSAPLATLDFVDAPRTSIVRAAREEKKHVTALLGSRADGAWAPSMLIFSHLQDESPSLPHEAADSSGLPLLLGASSSGWANGELFARFLRELETRLPRPSLITFDNCKAHISEDVQPTLARLLRRRLTIIETPPNMTYLLQALDRGGIREFKVECRRLQLKWLTEHQDAVLSMTSQQWRSHVVETVTQAMKNVRSEALRRGFLVSGVINALDGSQDNLVQVRLRSGLLVDRAAARRVAQEQEAERQRQQQLQRAEAERRAAEEEARRRAQPADTELPRLRPRR
jgi:hypothetical protein